MQQPQEQQQRREQQRKVITSSTANKNRPKSSFLSWFLNSSTDKNASPPSSTLTAIIPDEIYNNRSNSIENSRFSNNNQYINTKLELPDDIDETKSYANTEYAYKRNINSVTIRESTTITPYSQAAAVVSCHQVQIPDRRQSHLYASFHDAEEEEEEEKEKEEITTLFDYKHRSYYTSQLSPTINIIDVTSSNSTTLTRSATWQPSSSSSQLPPSPQFLSPLSPSSPPPPVPRHNYLASPTGAAENMIPARRTSRNYSEDPEIQAKLNAVLNSEKATYLSHVIQNSNSSNTNMYRRSTTPKSRKL
ncbi:hypothetical protein INT46_005176 [Mucor plumbeus]|uniref:Uncharacterized protein n=1 Tax=Mucor plumbeus TaxID=97098 RepID=A0A8H7RGE3_9FUNG|nr:hypothetical protein INT46_005176 [Mucor plumbeus]